jgi:serine/threonine-protein kinase
LTAFQVNQLLGGRGRDLIVGPYVLLERLGEGGMGQVFKARQRGFERVVALKLLRPELLRSADAVQRFYREAQAAARLTHPHVVLAYDAGIVNGRYYIAMEYAPGMDLARQVECTGPLSAEAAASVMFQTARGLEYAHQRGVIHRDIKPSNLLLTRPDVCSSLGGVHVKIADFGLARVSRLDSGNPSGDSLITSGVFIGTPDFIAPEQAVNPGRPDHRSDLYSLGCTFYYTLTGRFPFPDGTAIEKVIRHRLEQPQPLEQLRPEVPTGVRSIVQKLMAKNPADRFQTAGDAAAALHRVWQSLAMGSHCRRNRWVSSNCLHTAVIN